MLSRDLTLIKAAANEILHYLDETPDWIFDLKQINLSLNNFADESDKNLVLIQVIISLLNQKISVKNKTVEIDAFLKIFLPQHQMLLLESALSQLKSDNSNQQSLALIYELLKPRYEKNQQDNIITPKETAENNNPGQSSSSGLFSRFIAFTENHPLYFCMMTFGLGVFWYLGRFLKEKWDSAKKSTDKLESSAVVEDESNHPPEEPQANVPSANTDVEIAEDIHQTSNNIDPSMEEIQEWSITPLTEEAQSSPVSSTAGISRNLNIQLTPIASTEGTEPERQLYESPDEPTALVEVEAKIPLVPAKAEDIIYLGYFDLNEPGPYFESCLELWWEGRSPFNRMLICKSPICESEEEAVREMWFYLHKYYSRQLGLTNIDLNNQIEQLETQLVNLDITYWILRIKGSHNVTPSWRFNSPIGMETTYVVSNPGESVLSARSNFQPEWISKPEGIALEDFVDSDDEDRMRLAPR